MKPSTKSLMAAEAAFIPQRDGVAQAVGEGAVMLQPVGTLAP